METLENTVTALCKFLSAKKAEDVKAIHVADKTIITDWFIICSGRNETHVKALYEYVDEFANENGLVLKRTDGLQAGRWIVLDYSDILLHIFHPDERAFYNLDRLWDSGDNVLTFEEE